MLADPAVGGVVGVSWLCAAGEDVAEGVVGEAGCGAVASAGIDAAAVGSQQGVAVDIGEGVLFGTGGDEFEGFYGDVDAAGELECFFYDLPVGVADKVRGVAGAGVAVPVLVGDVPVPACNGVFFAVGYAALDVAAVVHAGTISGTVIAYQTAVAVAVFPGIWIHVGSSALLCNRNQARTYKAIEFLLAFIMACCKFIIICCC